MATDVAIALALSWKPLVKSNTSAVTTTSVTTNNVVVIHVFLVRRAEERCAKRREGFRKDGQPNGVVRVKT